MNVKTLLAKRITRLDLKIDLACVSDTNHSSRDMYISNKRELIAVLNQIKDGGIEESPLEEKPPLCLMLYKLHEKARISDIVDAIYRYTEEGKEIPLEWCSELYCRVQGLNKKESK